MAYLVQKQRAFFQKGVTKSLTFRKKSLERLEKGIYSYEKKIHQALLADLGKSEFESYMTEVGMTLSELSYVKKKVSDWAKPCPVLCSGPVSGKEL